MKINPFVKSLRLFDEAKKIIPIASQTFSKSFMQLPVGKSPMFFSYAKGAITRDIDGNEYIDTVNSLLPIILGYQDPHVDAAIKKQLKNGILFSLPSPLENDLAKLLCEHIPSAEMVRFMKNGSDATSAAVRLARAFTGRDKVISVGYHGWHDWYISTTSRSIGIPDDVEKNSIKLPFNNLNIIKNTFNERNDEIAALIIEPYCIAQPETDYLDTVKEICKKNGAILIFDEVVTGFRFSLGGAQKYYDVTPDLSCFGKAMGNGMPISCIVGKKEIMKLFEDVFVSGTFGGECLSIAASIATINKIDKFSIIENIWQQGNIIIQSLNKIIIENKIEYFVEVNGLAPWFALNFKDCSEYSQFEIRTRFIELMISFGIFTNGTFAPTYATRKKLDKIILGCEKTLKIINSEIQNSSLKENLGENIIQPVFKVR